MNTLKPKVIENWHDLFTRQITEFKVMVRPLKAVNKIHQAMADMLQKFSHKFNLVFGKIFKHNYF